LRLFDTKLRADSSGQNKNQMNEKTKPDYLEGTIQLSIKGEPIEINLKVPTKAVKPQRILPVLQKMTNTFVGISVDRVKEDGKEVSCKAGCGACCRQLVPISKIEAYQLAKLIQRLPALRKTKILKRFKQASKRLSEINWFEKFKDGVNLGTEKRRELGLEYFNQNIPCPFLEDESCSIHPDRPLACREYLVTSPAENCSAPTAKSIDMVPIAVKLSGEAYSFAKTLSKEDETGFIPLINLLDWVKDNPDSFPTKPGTEWVETILKRLSPTNDQTGS